MGLSDLLSQSQRAVYDSGGHLSLSKKGGNILVSDTPHLAVRQNALDAITRGDEHLAIFDRDQEDDSVVLFLFTHPPFLSELDGVVRRRNSLR